MASGTKCKSSEFAKVLENAITGYNQDVTDGIKADVRTVAKECVQDIKKRSPKRTGKYRRAWKQTTAFESESDIRIIVHAGEEYRRVHLLEDGHDIKRGNVKVGEAPPYPHVEPAEKAAEKKLMKKAKVRVKK